MKRLLPVAAACLLSGIFALPALAGDTLDDVRKKGVLVAGVKESTPPFGYRENLSGEIVGYDVDIAKAVAARLGVRLETRAVTSADRIPRLLDGDIDLIAATMTVNPDRGKLIDFSTAYFRTTQRFLARKGTIRTLDDLAGKKVATAAGSTAERNLKAALPGARVVLFDDYDRAARALHQGKVAALATDEVILAGLLAKAPGKAKFEISKIGISDESYGLGVRKGDGAFLDEVNAALKELGSNGEGKKMIAKWFPPAKGARSAAVRPAPARSASPKASAPPSSRSGSAAGVVYRRTAMTARFLMTPVKGTFVKGADVSVFDPQGRYIVGGKVKSIYEDEVYVDVDKGNTVEVGFMVTMNVPKGEAPALISRCQAVIAAVKAESIRESADRQEGNRQEFAADEKERRAEQNEFERLKFQQEGRGDWYHYRHY
ncbi:MAG TPA: transporter substrate-binding domain-containing protein [Candidatus Deferrimicrobiaceae bacterium]